MDEDHVVVDCTTKPISECPSARITKVFLKKLQSLNESEFIGSIRSIFSEHNYTVSDVLNDVHHLKYEHGVDGDDDKFDEIFDFLADALSGDPCPVTECQHIRRHYRDRGALRNEYKVTSSDDVDDGVLLDFHPKGH